MTAVIDKAALEEAAREPRFWEAPPRPVWEEEPSKAGIAGKGIVLAGACLAVLFPLWIVIVTSLSSKQTITAAGGLVLIGLAVKILVQHLGAA